MRPYEGMFLVDEGRASDDFNAIAAHITGLLERHGATVNKIEKWDARRLAYQINGRKRGMYILTNFSADPAKIDELRKDCQLSNLIMRAMVLREENVGLPVIEAPRRKPARAPEPQPAADAETATEAPAEPAAETPAEPAAEAPAEPEPEAQAEPEPEPDILGDVAELEEPAAEETDENKETT